MCMTDAIPQIELGLGDALERVVIVDDTQEIESIPALATEVPGLLTAEAARDLAVAVNHLAVGGDFDVITDPVAFQTAYEAQLASEDPSQGWQEGVMRLVDFGKPDFSEIKVPYWTGSAITFFAADATTGLPYRVEAILAPQAKSISEDDYKALALSPVAPVPVASAATELSEEDKAFIEMMSESVEQPDN